VFSWLFRGRRTPAAPVLLDDGSLEVRGTAFDPARADSAVVAEMAAAGVDLGRPLLLRHHLVLPDDAAAAVARRLVAQDGYAVTARPEDGRWLVRASRVQLLTGLSAAQERSRMAGLAQRLGGDVRGWDALGPR
jgi:hypothetical protein